MTDNIESGWVLTSYPSTLRSGGSAVILKATFLRAKDLRGTVDGLTRSLKHN